MPVVSDLGFRWFCCSLLIFPLLDCTPKSLRAHALLQDRKAFPKWLSSRAGHTCSCQAGTEPRGPAEMQEKTQSEHNSKPGADLAVQLLGVCSTALIYKNFGLPAIPVVSQVFLILGRLGHSRNRQAESRSSQWPA